MHFVSEILFEFYHVLNILQVSQLDESLRKFKRMDSIEYLDNECSLKIWR